MNGGKPEQICHLFPNHNKHEYEKMVHLSDFFRGLLEGVGLGLMILVLIRQKSSASSCLGRTDKLTKTE